MPVGTNKLVYKSIGVLLIFAFFGCKTSHLHHHKNLKVSFLSEFILPEDILVYNTQVGGLSGIDYYDGVYYLVCDSYENPRVYKARILIANDHISTIKIEKLIKIKDTSNFLDLESIRFQPETNQILLTSEGSITHHKDPLFFGVNMEGNIETIFDIPESFKADSPAKPRHNATLEGLCPSYDKKGYWISMELPLEIDGPEPKTTKTMSPVRITYIGLHTNHPEKQFAYLLEPIAKTPKGDFSINGLTDILEFDTNMFFTIERSYSGGWGNQGNTIKLFKVDASKATNTLQMENLEESAFIPAKKEMLLDFDAIIDRLTNHSVDNIEGITFGPLLSNGHKSLILVSDNNFNTMGPQLNQFILLEIED